VADVVHVEDEVAVASQMQVRNVRTIQTPVLDNRQGQAQHPVQQCQHAVTVGMTMVAVGVPPVVTNAIPVVARVTSENYVEPNR